MPIVETFIPGIIEGEPVVYFECSNCWAGRRTRMQQDSKNNEIEKMNYVPKGRDKKYFKIGEWISYKLCPICTKNTVFKV